MSVGFFVVFAMISTAALADEPNTVKDGNATGLFQQIGTFDVMAGNGSAVAEIVDVTKNGKQLVYTDSPNESIGFVDISDPCCPTGQGTVNVGGEPTSLVILDPLILVGVNTSPNFDNPSGRLVVVHRNNRNRRDSRVAASPTHWHSPLTAKRAAIVIENDATMKTTG